MLTGPDIESLGLVNTLDDVVSDANVISEEISLNLDDIDDEEIDYYIMNDDEIATKDGLWHQNNAAYLEELKGEYLISIGINYLFLSLRI